MHQEFHTWLDDLLVAVIPPRLGAGVDIDLIADTVRIIFEGLLGSSNPRDRPFSEIVQFLVDMLVAAAPQAARRKRRPAKKAAAESDWRESTWICARRFDTRFDTVNSFPPPHKPCTHVRR